MRMALNGETDGTVSLVDVLEEDDELEDEAFAVLGCSDPDNCSYSQGYVKRQALYACNTCTPKGAEPAGICLACSDKCHEGHDLFELYTKRNFRCDCGNSKFYSFKCKLIPEKDKLNPNNKYNHNFFGLYCICDRPYPDPEDQVPDEMIQCIVCEDWFHGRHLGCTLAECVELQEMVCEACMNKASFLWNYADHIAAPPVTKVSPCKEELEVKVEVLDGRNVEEPTEPEPSSSSRLERKMPTDGLSGCKRKHQQMVEPPHSRTAQCKLESMKAQGLCRPRQGAVFWPYIWRSQLCTCINCKRGYVAAGVPFLLDESDTVLAYENRGRMERANCDPLLSVLNTLNRVQQLEIIYAFNDMKEELKEYLQKFAEEGKMVAPEDIQQFFEKLQCRKRRRTTVSQYYCG